jgi:hypothetical protein
MRQLFLRVIGYLLPDALAWGSTLDTQARQFWDGLASTPAAVRAFVDGVWADIFPVLTRQLDLWEDQLIVNTTAVLSEDQRRARLDAWWKAQGGQDPRYLQDIFQANGFDVYVHEWFATAPTIPAVAGIARNPHLVLGGGPKYLMACDEVIAQCGDPEAQCGNSTNPAGRVLVNQYPGSAYVVPIASAEWPFILYIGGETYPAHASVLASRRTEFEDLVLRMCPGQQWLGMLITYV